jgi:hypothetical protein
MVRADGSLQTKPQLNCQFWQLHTPVPFRTINLSQRATTCAWLPRLWRTAFNQLQPVVQKMRLPRKRSPDA